MSTIRDKINSVKGTLGSVFSKIAGAIKDSPATEIFDKTVVQLKAVIRAADLIAEKNNLLTTTEIKQKAAELAALGKKKFIAIRATTSLLKEMVRNDKESGAGKTLNTILNGKDKLMSAIESVRTKVVSGTNSVLDGDFTFNDLKAKVQNAYKKWTEDDPVPPEIGPDGQPLNDEQKKIWVELEKEKIELNRIVLENEGPESSNFVQLAPPNEENKDGPKSFKEQVDAKIAERKEAIANKKKSIIAMAGKGIAKGLGSLFWKTITGGGFISKGAQSTAGIPFKIAKRLIFGKAKDPKYDEEGNEIKGFMGRSKDAIGGAIGKGKDAIKDKISSKWHDLTDPTAPDIDPNDPTEAAAIARWEHRRAVERGIFGRAKDKMGKKIGDAKDRAMGIFGVLKDKAKEKLKASYDEVKAKVLKAKMEREALHPKLPKPRPVDVLGTPPEKWFDGRPLTPEEKLLWIETETAKIEFNKVILKTEGPNSKNFKELAKPKEMSKLDKVKSFIKGKAISTWQKIKTKMEEHKKLKAKAEAPLAKAIDQDAKKADEKEKKSFLQKTKEKLSNFIKRKKGPTQKDYADKVGSVFNRPKIEAEDDDSPETEEDDSGLSEMGKRKKKLAMKKIANSKKDKTTTEPKAKKPKAAPAVAGVPAKKGLFGKLGSLAMTGIGKVGKGLSKVKGKIADKIKNSKPEDESFDHQGKLDSVFNREKAKADAKKKEVENEKAEARARLGKKEGGGKGGWLGSILGALSSLGTMLISGFGKMMGAALMRFAPTLISGLGGIMARVAGSSLVGGAVKLGIAAAGTVMPMLATAATAVGAALLSPVGLAVGAVLLAAALAYAGYMAYKYLTRNSSGNITRIRLMQYGLGEDQKDNFNIMFKLEGVFQKFLVKDGTGFTIKPLDEEANKTIREDIFKISSKPEDEPRVDTLRRWLNTRFVPTYKAHVNALEKVKSGTYFDKIDTLSAEQKVAYIKDCSPSASVYSQEGIPIIGYPKITVTQDQITKLTELALSEIKVEVKDKYTKNGKLVVEPKPATTPLDIPKPAIEPAANKPVKPLITVNPDAETAPKVGGSSGGSTITSSGNISKAGGPLRGGNSSMIGLSVPSNVDIKNLEPNMLNLLTGMADEYHSLTGKSIPVTSGFRSYEKQAALYAKDPSKAAKPGRSLHEKGLAVDIDPKTADELDKLGLMAKYGFTRPIGQEPWHVEPNGVSIDVANAVSSASAMRDAVLASPGRGGGGYGTIGTSANKLKRDKALQMTIFKSKNGTPITPKAEEGTAGAIKEAVNTPVIPKTDKPPSGGSSATAEVSKPVNGDSEIAPAKTTASSDKDSSPAKNTDMIKFSPNMSVEDAITKAASVTGVSRDMLMKFGQLESGLKSGAANSKSSAVGVFQFVDKTWVEMLKKYGAKYNIPQGASKSNPYYSALMAAEYIKENLKATASTAKAAGVDSVTAAYLGHHFGATGANELLSACSKSPDTPCDQVLSGAAVKSNMSQVTDKGQMLSVGGLVQKIATKTGGTVNINQSLSKGESVVKSGGSTDSGSASAPAPAAVTAVKPAPEPSYPLNSKPTLSAKPSTPVDRSTDVASTNQIATSQIEAIATKQLDVLMQMLTALKSIDSKTNNPTTQGEKGPISSGNTKVKPPESSVNSRRSSSAVDLYRTV